MKPQLTFVDAGHMTDVVYARGRRIMDRSRALAADAAEGVGTVRMADCCLGP